MSKTKRRDKRRAEAQERAAEARFEGELGTKADKPKSVQPRLTRREESGVFGWDSFFASLLVWAEDAEGLSAWPSHRRDKELRAFWKKEPLLAGVINSVCQMAANRGWSLKGPPRQVNKYHRILMDSYGPGNTRGWRQFIKGLALDYYSTDNGAWSEVMRAGRNGPLWGLASFDSDRMTARQDWQYPALYEPSAGSAVVKLRPIDYFRLVELPDTSESTRGQGFCAVSRAALLAQTIRYMWLHDKQKLSNLPPQGFLLLKKIFESQWQDVEVREKAEREGRGMGVYPGLRIMAGDADSDAVFISFSQVPDQFDRRVVVDIYMAGLALIFGFDVREFWPASAGPLGSAHEAEIQHEKAALKGGASFALALADALNADHVLPDSVQFEFDEKDDKRDLLVAQVRKAQADWIIRLYAGEGMSGGIISISEARALAVEEELIPAEWTPEDEEAIVHDVEGETEEGEETTTPPEEELAPEQTAQEQAAKSIYGEKCICKHRDGRTFPMGMKMADKFRPVGRPLPEAEALEVSITPEDIERALAARENIRVSMG